LEFLNFSFNLAFRYAAFIFNCFNFQLYLAAIAIVILRLSACTVGEYVLLYPMPSLCLKPLATHLAFFVPSSFVVNIHLPSINIALRGTLLIISITL